MTIKPLDCGCTVAPADRTNPEQPGTLQNPLVIERCKTHAALELPPVEWEAIAREDPAEIFEMAKQLEAIAERAARLARYLDRRHAPDQGHRLAVVAQNKAGRIVHEKAFGYNSTHDLNI
jgi:hypothetical protein